MKKPVALIDMDGTLADYNGAMVRDLASVRDPDNEYPIHSDELEEYERQPFMKARMDLIKRQPGWWRDLDTLPAGFSILNRLRRLEYQLHILTRGPKHNATAWAEKVAWVRNWVPDVHGITITLDKSLVYGKVLVDDWPPYIKGWLKHRPRGLVIMPDQPWNKDYSHPQVIRFTVDNHAEVFEALAEKRKA